MFYYKTYFLSKSRKHLKSKGHLNYLAKNDPMFNFKKIIQIFIELNKNANENEMLFQINNIDNFLSDIFQIYNIDFNDKTYFPPMKEYLSYSYNYFTRILLTILIKFKKQRKIFNLNQEIDNEYINFSTIKGKFSSYINVKTYFEYLKNLFENLNKEHKKKIKIIKIIRFYLICLEMTRDYFSIKRVENKVVSAMNSSPITEQILERSNIFKINSNKKLEKIEKKIGI